MGNYCNNYFVVFENVITFFIWNDLIQSVKRLFSLVTHSLLHTQKNPYFHHHHQNILNSYYNVNSTTKRNNYVDKLVHTIIEIEWKQNRKSRRTKLICAFVFGFWLWSMKFIMDVNLNSIACLCLRCKMWLWGIYKSVFGSEAICIYTFEI